MVKEKKFVVDVESLRGEQLNILEAIYKEGEKHIREFHERAKAFKYPERRVKCFDTVYYEQVMPIIVEILRNHKETRKLQNV